mmetsp:Transcript_17604/g.43509  ORF Transcript_17604/g.43509 Transcript_17604/m.43509 type:complete len:264 (+) Transcript_17604:215-1006(+)
MRSCTSLGANMSSSSWPPMGRLRTYSLAHSGRSGLPSSPAARRAIGSLTVAFHCLPTRSQNVLPDSASLLQMVFTNSSQYTSLLLPQSMSHALIWPFTCCSPADSNARRRLMPLSSLAVASASRRVNSISVPLGSCMIITARWHALMKILRTSAAISRSISSDMLSSSMWPSPGGPLSPLLTLLPASCPIISPRTRPSPPMVLPLPPTPPAPFRYFSSAELGCSTQMGPRSDQPCSITISHAMAVASRMSRLPNELTFSGPYR